MTARSIWVRCARAGELRVGTAHAARPGSRWRPPPAPTSGRLGDPSPRLLRRPQADLLPHRSRPSPRPAARLPRPWRAQLSKRLRAKVRYTHTRTTTTLVMRNVRNDDPHARKAWVIRIMDGL